jgi:hypothetical protein
MKLTNQQVNALASKIYDELYKNNKRNYDDTMATILSRFVRTKEHEAMVLLEDSLGYSYLNKITVMQKMYDMPKQIKTPTQTSIRNEIILSTIDCANLDELIEKVKTNVSE